MREANRDSPSYRLARSEPDPKRLQSPSQIDPDLKMAIGMGCLKLDDVCGCSRWIEVENLDRTHYQLCKGMGTRYDRCPMAFLSAIALAATVIFWL